ncbi:zf-TFIIB domain-containing protein [Paenochrobactrum sp. BZR 588]|uniref:TFIIB-type zinc ribbon-containing protein n=1 Tax=Paenochrobactrum TaxID=999488 RepID=UPI0035BBFFAE
MLCPIDNSELVMSERQGIEIDYCPKCRGVWLDRGELDKIIERSVPAEEPRTAYHNDQRSGDRQYDGRAHDGRYRRDDDYEHKKYLKKKSLLGELFDF